MSPVRDEQAYEEALARIGELMGAEPGTPEFDELDVRATLVEAYEREHHRIDLPDPVDAILFRMEQAGLERRDLVPYIGSPSKVSEILNRKRPLTFAMARALHRGLGIPADVLMQEATEEAPAIDASRLPWVEIVKRGWIEDFDGTVEEARRRAGELAALLFPTDVGACSAPSFYRRTVRSAVTMDDHALAAWTARIVFVACRSELPTRYEVGCLDDAFAVGLARLSFLDDGPALAGEYLAKHGIHLVHEPHLPRTRVDGAATLLPDGSPVVAVSCRYDRLDNFWFSLFHELAHVALHLRDGGDIVFVDDLASEGRDEQEREADVWARDHLIPPGTWAQMIHVRAEAEVIDCARRFGIGPAVIAGRIRYENGNYRLLGDLVGQGQVKRHFAGF